MTKTHHLDSEQLTILQQIRTWYPTLLEEWSVLGQA